MFFETTLTAQRIAESSAAGLWPDQRLQDHLTSAAAATPDKAAIVDRQGRYTYRGLAELVDAVARALLEMGVRPADVVALQLPNWNEFVVLMLAIERIGAVVNPIAPIFRQNELRGMFRLGRPVVVAIPAEFRGFDYRAMLAELWPETPSLRHVIVLGGEPGAGMTAWDDVLALGRSSAVSRQALDLLTPDPNAVAELIFTSGTTGEPKGVLHTHNTLLAASQLMIGPQGLAETDVFHMASTFAHQTGYLFGARMCIHAGGTGVFQEVWDPVEFVRLIERERVTMSNGATPFLADTLRAPNLDQHDISSLRIFGCFGAPIPQPLVEEALRRLPCRVMPGWGMTEIALVTMTRPGDPVEKVVGSDGIALPGTAVRIVDEEGQPPPDGSDGRLFWRGHTAFVGYIQGRVFTQQFFDAQGWFDTGDRAVMHDDGFIRISGRTKDIIIRGGENVPVKEIEDVLMRHPKVRNAAVVAAPDPRLGEVGCACIIPEPGETLTFDDLRAFLAEQQVTRQYWPERLALMDAFPTTPSGKIQKFRLRELVTAQGAAAAAGGGSA